jgi:16S rRNA (cytidine1402-2'-O)-methyltransferase
MKFLAEEERTIVFYESPHRIEKTLTELGLFLGMERNACVAREISKKFEEYHRGTLNELAEYFKINTPKGEMVVVVAGKS